VNFGVAVWLSGNVLASVNVVALHQTRLFLWLGKPFQYVASHPGQLSLLPFVEPWKL